MKARKKALSFCLALLLALTLSVPMAPLAAAAEISQDIRDLLHSPGLKPGDLLKLNPPISLYNYIYDYDCAVIGVTDRVNYQSLELVVTGDCIELTEVAIIYADGTRIEGIRESFSDGERVTLYHDPAKQGMMREDFIGYKIVTGDETTVCQFVYDNTPSSKITCSPNDAIDSIHQPTRPKNRCTGLCVYKTRVPSAQTWHTTS